jgi:hypothetical protein
MRCDRCNGEGMVITYDGRPLWMDPIAGRQRLREIARGDFDALRRQCTDVEAANKLFAHAKLSTFKFMPTTCPDCNGKGSIECEAVQP